MTTWFTSDLHFGHKNVCRYTGRPYFSVSEMNQALIDNWNKVVTNNDTVWHLGDFAFGGIGFIKEILSQLKGKEINMIIGNHDKKLAKKATELIQSNYLNSVQHYKEVSINGQHIVLCHYAMRVWNKHHRGTWMLYGHSHGTLPPYGKSVDVGVDSQYVSNEYRPYCFEEIKEFMDLQQSQKVDHHY